MYTQGWDNHLNFSWKQYQPMDYVGGQLMSMSCQYASSYQIHMQAFTPQQLFAPLIVEQQQFSSLENTLKQFIQVTMQNT